MSFRYIQFGLIAFSLSFIWACKNDPKPSGEEHPTTIPGSDDPDKQGEARALTIDGRKLLEWADPDSIKILEKKELDQARSYYLAHLEDVKSYIIYGNAYLKCGRPENAISVYSKGLEKFANTSDLHMGRAIAYLQGRQFQDAINDCWQAGKGIEGQPQAKGILKLTGADSVLNPTLHFINYLCMGVAFQCSGDFGNAEKMFEVCGDFSRNPDLYNISYYYQYQCYTRAGREADAKNIMDLIDKGKNSLAPGRPYLDALLYWKGLISETELINIDLAPKSSAEAEPWLIKAYALAYKAEMAKKDDLARSILQKILKSGYWSYYPYILAEADMNKLKGVNAPKTEVIELKADSRKGVKK